MDKALDGDQISAWCAGVTTGIGTELSRQYTGYVRQPTTPADPAITLDGWKPLAGAACSPDLGTPWTIGGKRCD